MPESFNLENSDTLGIQLVVILVDQLDGELELKRDPGTEFVIRFAVQKTVKDFFREVFGSVFVLVFLDS